MAEIFQCPNCHAALDYDQAGGALTVRCAFCQSTVIVPENLRQGSRAPAGNQARALSDAVRLLQSGRKIEAIKSVREGFGVGLKEAKELIEALERGDAVRSDSTAIQIDLSTLPTDPSPQPRRGIVGCIVLSILSVGLLTFLGPLLLGGGFAFLGLTRSETVSEPLSEGFSAPEIIITILPFLTEAPALTPTPGFAGVVQQFGGQEGIGPGFFNDTRQIEVDGEGRIYTADYDGGRIQVFDAEGGFLETWQLPADIYVGSMAADRNGTLYVLEQGTIQRYDGLTGTRLDPLPYPGVRFDVVAVAPDGAVVAAADERLVRFDRSGAVTLDVADPFAQFERVQLFYDEIAVDGAGNIYVVGNYEILRFSPDGVFVDRIGSEGNEPDQFRTSPNAIAVDGRGWLFVDNAGGIRVFDDAGRYVDTINFLGAAFGMVFTTENELLVMDRNGNQVLTYALNR